MGSAALFVLAILGFAAVLVLFVFKSPAAAIRYFKTDDGRKVFQGIVGFLLVGIVAASLAVREVNADESLKGEWFAYGEVYLGVDHPFRQSPQCVADGPNDKLTSNGGFRANIYQSADERFEFNSKYTHHSCAFNSDRNLYDAVGFELTYRLW